MTAIFNLYALSALFQRFYHLAIESVLPSKFSDKFIIFMMTAVPVPKPHREYRKARFINPYVFRVPSHHMNPGSRPLMARPPPPPPPPAPPAPIEHRQPPTEEAPLTLVSQPPSIDIVKRGNFPAITFINGVVTVFS